MKMKDAYWKKWKGEHPESNIKVRKFKK